ncbi:C69 family dipeptidase [Kosmotoga sp. DU53]|uniref:C69 family dipeptidase n=1 Tax=Kosmotoga sp. DU53 TaxID=1310160 RepID=UPI0007C4EE65|nr:C69 family dipeptidase [Kosmotoga sp. DU53]
MCDTLVVAPKLTGGILFFAKNSDREPNEPQSIVYFPSRIPEEKEIGATYITLPQVKRTNALILSKPSWIWGGEMGVNDKNVVIGNEAVFTKEPVNKNGLLGMDILRIVLERADSADSALEIITSLLEIPGQGGNGALNKKLMYHNSFIIADKSKVWLLETAGKYWVAKEIKTICTISNALTIGNDFDMIHPEAIEHAVKKHWCKSIDDFEFKKAYGKELYASLSGGKIRKERSEKLLRDALPDINVKKLFEILRDHGGKENITKGSMKTVCMHAGGIISSQTTASMVCEIGEKATVWVTSGSAPCLSIFKPVWFDSEKSSLPYNSEDEALKHWFHWERFHRRALKNYSQAKELFEGLAIPLEKKLLELVEELKSMDTQDFDELCKITKMAFDESWKIGDLLIEKSENLKKGKASPVFRLYWNLQNKRFFGKKGKSHKTRL